MDDDPHWLEVVSTYLQESGYNVLKAQDATEAMARVEDVKLGLIILDLDLAGESGLMLLSFLKRNQIDVPVVLYTGLSHDDEEILAILRQGAQQYVRKGSLQGLGQAVEMAFRQT